MEGEIDRRHAHPVMGNGKVELDAERRPGSAIAYRRLLDGTVGVEHRLAGNFVDARVQVPANVGQHGAFQVFIFQIDGAPIVIHAAAGQIFTQHIRIVELVVRELVERRIWIGHALVVSGQRQRPLPHAHLRRQQSCQRQDDTKMEVMSHLDSQYSGGVLVVHLFEDRLRQPDSVNSPAALRRDGGGSVVEIFVFRFQKAKIDFIQLVVEDLLRELVAMRGRVGGEQNPVLIFIEELSRRPRLASEFSDARRKVDEHVRIAVEILRNVLQVFREVAGVQHNKLRLGVPGDDTVASRDQLVIAGKVPAMERPVWMIVQLLITLVEAVGWQEECDRIRNMNCYWKIELAARIPHGIKTWVVNLYQRTRRYVLAEIKSERLENFQSARAIAMRTLDGLCLQLRVIRFFEAGIGGLSESVKTAGIGTVVFSDGFGEAMIVATGQVHHRANVLAVHDREQLLRSSQIFAIGREFHTFLRFGRAGDVGMKVDERKFRTLDARLIHAEHASWFVLRKLQGRGLGWASGLKIAGSAHLDSRSGHEAHSIQPMATTDHLTPPAIAQARALAWRCPRSSVAH